MWNEKKKKTWKNQNERDKKKRIHAHTIRIYYIHIHKINHLWLTARRLRVRAKINTYTSLLLVFFFALLSSFSCATGAKSRKWTRAIFAATINYCRCALYKCFSDNSINSVFFFALSSSIFFFFRERALHTFVFIQHTLFLFDFSFFIVILPHFLSLVFIRRAWKQFQICVSFRSWNE